MATMKDVAKKAGVSVSTVSYVLSGTRPISEETKTQILQAMEELDFHPNVVARALASRRSGILALLFSPTERGLGITELDFVKAASEAARALNHHLILLTEGMDGPQDLRFLKQQGLVDGVILMEVHLHDERIQLLRELGVPFAIIGRSEDPGVTTSIDIDFEATMREMLDHLAALGHRKVVFVNQPKEEERGGYGPAVRSDEAFLAQTRRLGLQGFSVCCHATPRDGYLVCQELLENEPSWTAVVCMNDRALPGVLQALTEGGRRVPDDVSIIAAVSSARAAEMMVPPLTSTDVPSVDLARLAVEGLVGRLADPKKIQPGYLIPCRLNLRNSTAKVSSSVFSKEVRA